MNYLYSVHTKYGLFIGLFLLLLSGQSYAENFPGYRLAVKPQECVSLYQGQTCYFDVTVSWESPELGSYCLYNSLTQQPLHCWNNNKRGKFEKEMQANQNVTFTLRKEGQSDVLAQAQVTMAWVYRKSSRNRSKWRLF